ncbi:MAG TPA: SpoIID/LytB domain-containing protein [bacterium]|nr:SpoIID/LytB domain-containing protein [bacterium]
MGEKSRRILRHFTNEPVLRVNVAGGNHSLDFQVTDEFSIENNSGETIIGPLRSGLHWRVKMESYEPAQFIYSILVHTTQDEVEAGEIADQLNKQGLNVRIRELGGVILLNEKHLTDNRQLQVLVGEFNSSTEAYHFQWSGKSEYEVEVIHEKIRESRGVLEIFDAQYERSSKLQNQLTLRPLVNDTETELFDVMVSKSFPFEKKIKKRFQGPITFRIGDHGNIMAICEIPLEKYLEGVLSAVMDPKDPIEALKSQAVASRGLALANLGLFHPNEPFDFCSDHHCQLFIDNTKVHETVLKAIHATRGEVLYSNRQICETLYSRLCGGHTSDNHPIHSKPYAPGLQSVYDGKSNHRRKNLNKEGHVDDWIKSNPKVYCNPQIHEWYPLLENAGEAFRWEVTHSRKKLEEIIIEKTGEDIGTLFDIVPVKRGNSGRLKEIEIIGSRKNLYITKDINIRQTLDRDILQSSCFIIESELGVDGIPLSFRFIGAGLGHGAGLCQTGATVMAHEGQSYLNILNHYFKGGKMHQIYQ